MVRVELVSGIVEEEPVNGWASYASDGTATMVVSGSRDEVVALARDVLARVRRDGILDPAVPLRHYAPLSPDGVSGPRVPSA